MPRRNNTDSGSRETSRSNTHHQNQDSGNVDRPRHTQANSRHSDDRGHDYKRGNGSQMHSNDSGKQPGHRDSQSQRNRARNGGGNGRGRSGAGAGGRRDESSEPSDDLDDRRSESDPDDSESDTKPAWMMDRSARSQMQPSVNHSKQPWLNPALAFFIKDGLHVINLRNEHEEILGAGKKDKRGGNTTTVAPTRDDLRTRAETQPQSAAQSKDADRSGPADRDKKGKDQTAAGDLKRRSTPEPERSSNFSAPSNHTPAQPSVLDLIKTAKTVPETNAGISGTSSGSTMLSSAPPVARESFTVVAGTSSPTPEETAQSKKLSAKAQPWRPSSQQTSAPDLRQLASQLHVSASGHLDPTLASGTTSGNTWTANSPASSAGSKAYFVSSPPMVQVGTAVPQGSVLVPTVVETMLPPSFTAQATSTSTTSAASAGNSLFTDSSAASRLPSLSPLPSLYSDNLWSVEGSGWGDVTQILKSSSISKEKDSAQADAAILNAVSSMPQTPVLTPAKPSAPASADGPPTSGKPSSPPLKGATNATLPPPATAPLPVAVQAAAPVGLSTSPMKAQTAPATTTIAYATAPMQGNTATAVQAAAPQATYAYAYQPMATAQPAQAVQWVQPQSTAVYYVQAPTAQPAQQAMIYAYAQQPAAQYGYYYQPADQGAAAQATQVYWPATY
jgi:hypothetical protein